MLGGFQGHHFRHQRNHLCAGYDRDPQPDRHFPVSCGWYSRCQRRQLCRRGRECLLCRCSGLGGCRGNHLRHQRNHVQPQCPLYPRPDRDFHVSGRTITFKRYKRRVPLHEVEGGTAQPFRPLVHCRSVVDAHYSSVSRTSREGLRKWISVHTKGMQ